LKNLLESRLNRSALGYVAAIALRISATGCYFAGNPLGSVLVDIQQADAGSAIGKSLSDGATNAATRSGDDGSLAIEAKRT
jgi:hypothetical protein